MELDSKPAMPASAMVGTSGNAGERLSPVTASALRLLVLKWGGDGRKRSEHDVHLARKQIGGRRRESFIGHVHDVHFCRMLKHLRCDMRSLAGRGIAQSPRLRAREGNQLRDARRRR